jgi:hypothetical protein
MGKVKEDWKKKIYDPLLYGKYWRLNKYYRNGDIPYGKSLSEQILKDDLMKKLLDKNLCQHKNKN